VANRSVFQKIKAALPVRILCGGNQNAIEIQIGCTLISVLLLTVIHEYNTSNLAFSNVTVLLSMHLAGYISIKDLLESHKIKRVRQKKELKLPTLFG